VEDFTILPGDKLICSIEFRMNIMAFHKWSTEQHLLDHPQTAPFGTQLRRHNLQMPSSRVEEKKKKLLELELEGREELERQRGRD
jgi:hypothetical protein